MFHVELYFNLFFSFVKKKTMICVDFEKKNRRDINIMFC